MFIKNFFINFLVFSYFLKNIKCFYNPLIQSKPINLQNEYKYFYNKCDKKDDIIINNLCGDDKILDLEEFKYLMRKAISEGIILLKNDNNSLPLKPKEKISIFGRTAINYYFGGWGTGGMAIGSYNISLIDALKYEDLVINNDLINLYKNWIKKNKFDVSKKWGNQKKSQKEMPITDDILKFNFKHETALIFIGRNAGEAIDLKPIKGEYYLTEIEEDMIKKVTKSFEKTIVILNVGNVIDMSWVKKYNPNGVIYVWIGGNEAGIGISDVLMGRESPSGKLPDCIAKNYNDYPSSHNFGLKNDNLFYIEDIYVGYKYFETFFPEKIEFPFGFGLSYSKFKIEGKLLKNNKYDLDIEIKVKNIGNYLGKEVVQIYIEKPQGTLGNPLKELIYFNKTKKLNINETEIFNIKINKKTFAVFDDKGIHKNSLLLEEGIYKLYLGGDVHNSKYFGEFKQNLIIFETYDEVLYPMKKFKRIKPFFNNTLNKFIITYENVTLQRKNVYYNLNKYRKNNKKNNNKKNKILNNINNKDSNIYTLEDIFNHKISIDQFIKNLSIIDLISLSNGIGNKTHILTGGNFGGLTNNLKKYKIPNILTSDAVTGINMNHKYKTFNLPSSILIASTFNLDLIYKLYSIFALFMRKNSIDIILGPGTNIHRNPLGGRNFEYYSEDSYLSGKITATVIKALQKYGVTGTMKHCCCNNQEEKRTSHNIIISARALREIYLKPFEIGVKEGKAMAIMSSYNKINELHSSSNYDLLTTVIRNEWGFNGIILSDWHTKTNIFSYNDTYDKYPLVFSQNDLFMIYNKIQDSYKHFLVCLNRSLIYKFELERNVRNIIDFLLNGVYILREFNYQCKKIHKNYVLNVTKIVLIDEILNINVNDLIKNEKNKIVFELDVKKSNLYIIEINAKNIENNNNNISLFLNNSLIFEIENKNGINNIFNIKKILGYLDIYSYYLQLKYNFKTVEIINLSIKLFKNDFENNLKV